MAHAPDAPLHQARLISIIIPALNEEAGIGPCLESVLHQEPPFEILLVDGGSTDRTLEIAESYGVKAMTSPPGRPGQMNTGARLAKGEIFLFLHADTRLPLTALKEIRKSIDLGYHYGAFPMRFDIKRLDMQFGAWVANIYSRITRDLFGDRAIYVGCDAFEAVDGYRDVSLMEDVDLSNRLREAGYRMRIPGVCGITSGRRFVKAGIWRPGWWAWKLLRAYHKGHDLDEIAEKFYASRDR